MTETESLAASTLDLDDIQGNLLHGYHMTHARHLALAVARPDGVRSLIGRLAAGEGSGLPAVTSSRRWGERGKPAVAVNLGLTCEGLQRLGVPEPVLRRFPEAFAQGPAWPRRARHLGDTGVADPHRWELGSPAGEPVHLLLSVHADRVSELDDAVRTLTGASLTAGAQVVWQREAQALPGDRVHFGYRDGIAQPRVAGTGKRRDDAQPAAPAGDFLLGRGHRNSYGGNFLGDLPPALGDNATYGAFRVLYQDAPAFERFLRLNAQRWQTYPEWLAAKLMGRWRNGVPVSLAPDERADLPPSPAYAALNRFDYAPSADEPMRDDDGLGLRCPVGAHIRRLNPRGAMVMGLPHVRRLVRRAMPYGPDYVPDGEGLPVDDGIDRGLVGYFLCGDLAAQFEFVQAVWANTDLSACGLRGTRDPVLGAQPPAGGRFVIRTRDRRDPIVLTDLPRLVTTRGALYCLLPGLGGLRYLASLA